MTLTESLTNIVNAVGGAVDAGAHTKTELLRQIISACGGNCDELPDNLESTLLQAVAEHVSGGGSGVVVCEEESVYTNHIVAASGILKVSLPNATRLGDTMFNGCKTLVEINAPKVKYIDSGCFGRCSSLTSVYLPKLNGVGLSVFAGCTSLETIELPLLYTIESCTFVGCTNLTNIHLPYAESVIANAFDGCVSLTKIELPCVTSVDAEAFVNCTNLFAVILRTTETVCIIQVDSFKNTKIMDENGMPTGKGFVYIPASMDAAYREVYEPAFADLGMDGAFDLLFRKIEDYPEICG